MKSGWLKYSLEDSAKRELNKAIDESVKKQRVLNTYLSRGTQ